MRRLILSIFFSLCATGAFAYNESVAAISYNPSRLGAYTHLKAVQTATLQGGVALPENNAALNIKSKGAVSLQDNNHKCKKDNQCQASNLNTITTIKPASGCETEYCNEHSTSANTSVVMQKRSDNPLDSYSYGTASSEVNASTAGTHLTMNAKGGNSTFTAKGDSYIDSFKHESGFSVQNLKITAGTLQAGQSLYAKESYTLGNITVKPGSGDQQPASYKFVDRTTSSGTVKVLAACSK